MSVDPNLVAELNGHLDSIRIENKKLRHDLEVLTTRFNALLEFMQVSVNTSKEDVNKITLSDDKRFVFHEFDAIKDVNPPR